MIGLARLRRTSKHPSPEQAVAALAEGLCMYSPVSACSGGSVSVGLRSNEDDNAVLTCRAHFGRLRQIDAGSLGKLERSLLEAFLTAPTPAPEPDEGPRVVFVKAHA